MLTLRIVGFLSTFTFIVAGAQAENCSGGANGGMDDTGNQCSSPGGDLDAAQSRLGLERIAAVTARPPADRFVRSADPPADTAPGSRTGQAGEATCSGGPGGGMDATGNQCSQPESADLAAGPRVDERQALAGLRN